MARIERDYIKTSGMNDVDLALKFYDDFNTDDDGLFGKIIPNETFNEWIESLNFSHINHGWDTPEGNKAWSGYRSFVRRYLKNGVMDTEYGSRVDSGKYEPYILKINLSGIDLKIVEYSEDVIDTAMGLATKRQKTIKSQTKNIKAGFKAMSDVYGVKDLKVDMQAQLVEAQNSMRLHMEMAFDEIYKKTVKDTADMIAASRSAMKQITDTAKQFNSASEKEDTVANEVVMIEQPLKKAKKAK